MNYKTWLGLLLSIGLVVLVIRRVDLGELSTSLQSANYILLAPAVIALSMTQVIRSWRWSYLIESIKPIRFRSLLAATCVGAMTDMVVPARTGDFVRAYLIGQKEHISKASALATIVVEKVLDLLTVIAVAVPALAFVALPADASPVVTRIRSAVFVAIAACIVLIVAFALLRSRTDLISRSANRWLTFLPKKWLNRFTDVLEGFASGLQTLQSGRHVVVVLLLSALLWSAFALSNYLILRAFAFDLPIYASFVFLIFQILGVTLPSSPGFVGTYHAAVLAGFALFGVSSEAGLGVAITMHAAFFFPFILLGALFLWTENWSFRTLQSVRSDEVPNTAPNAVPNPAPNSTPKTAPNDE